ncbi:MAG: CsbD family protein [Gammaproteobacteria bacterium]|nr:CsbD family protein [Gammaproteobacteria bacterium]
MNKDIIKGKWKEIKGSVKKQWGKITDDDLTALQGSYEELEGLLQKRYGYQKQEAEKAIKEFVDKYEYESKEKTTY